jgi:hypothetical protein
MVTETFTAEEIAQHYSAANDSVTVINELGAIETLTDEQKNNVDRNVQHLEIMVAKDYWTSEDLTPFNSAITAGKAKIA